MSSTGNLIISVSADGDDHELDMLTAELAEEIALLPVSDVSPVTSGEAPENTRALEAIVIGKLAVKFGPQVLNALVSAVRGWMQRSGARSVELKIGDDSITLKRASVEDQKRLLDIFVEKHSAPAPDGTP
ncbi:MAG TPA: hypothetical protein VHZ03_15560 [Trebonia sp.]|jgi:hypothetical protein|nr:hypothetical protein [Trebonia sp.]